MPVTVVVGGQFGSEGKGKVAHYFAREKQASVAVRVGGSNSGHTVIDNQGKARIFRVLPTASILDNTICVLGPGSYIDIEVLEQEIKSTGLTADRLLIDPNAYVLRAAHKEAERAWHLGSRIGSTLSGTGAAVVERAQRISERYLAGSDNRLAKYCSPTVPFLRSCLNRGEHVVVEGTQGFGLSLLHSPYYPKVTSRDTTAAAFLAETGLSPFDVSDIALVIRAFPIRVAGDSGHLPNETDWATVARKGGWSESISEYSSVTKKVRRVGHFDPRIVRAAIDINKPNLIVLNHLDYLNCKCIPELGLTADMEEFVSKVEGTVGQSIDYFGLGPANLIGPQGVKANRMGVI